MSIDEKTALQSVKNILEYLGENVDREGLVDTPQRVLRSWEKLYGGYKIKPEDVAKATFKGDGYDQMIVLKHIEFYSTCEHHMIPFTGKISIGYLPNKAGKVLGISKLARIVEIYARRLQIQERMTEQIAGAVEKLIKANGVGVIVEAQHMCMTARGVEKQNSVMVTSSMRGSFRESQTKAEFLSIIKERD
jgi:GTP cyclohydrolase I